MILFSFFKRQHAVAKHLRTLLLSISVILSTLLSISSVQAGEGDHHDEHAAEPAKGPHGGRLLTQDHFAVEVSIYENGVEPELRLYFYQDKQPISPEKISASVQLNRLGEAPETIQLRPELDYLL
ncbi:MAG: hypothetical protein KKB45_17505, partial [Gammaproteobacteria bacterium]|nr:hypothetical protein [Gammaproteobacteria bacterium]